MRSFAATSSLSLMVSYPACTTGMCFGGSRVVAAAWESYTATGYCKFLVLHRPMVHFEFASDFGS